MKCKILMGLLSMGTLGMGNTAVGTLNNQVREDVVNVPVNEVMHEVYDDRVSQVVVESPVVTEVPVVNVNNSVVTSTPVVNQIGVHSANCTGVAHQNHIGVGHQSHTGTGVYHGQNHNQNHR